ncbi:MAG: ABC transporter permease [SAR324 cluster bacterium]|jgi:peptide/nickel transport system permease protein|nr:ABC transporter permease [SAR324 cluster bacterium]
MEKHQKKLLDKYKSQQNKYKDYQEILYSASQFKLIKIKFKKHKLAQVSLYILALFYLIALFAEFVAPYAKSFRVADRQFIPPNAIHIFDASKALTRPFIYEYTKTLDKKTFKWIYKENKEKTLEIKLFCTVEPFDLVGIIKISKKLFCTEKGYIHLFGTNKLGLDLFSQTIYASRISLCVGLIGVFLSFVIGVLLGGISGYFGGSIDNIIQRLIELFISIPQIPLWIALSAAVPDHWSGIQTFFAITIILSFVGWTGLARVVRGRLISLREEDYVMAAKISNASNFTIIKRHLIPGFFSYLIVHATLSVPQMILGETTLSFLGLGILPPETSWGALLQDAQQITMIANYPWYLIPCLFVIVSVLLFNFIGDGIRDAADPYSQ